jgi:hypothetical protein
VECCRDACPSERFSHLHRGTLELCQSDHQILGHLPYQGPSPPIAQFGRVASSRRSVGGSKLLPFKNDRGHCVLGDLSMLQTFFGTLPKICSDTILSQSSTDNSFDLMAWNFALTCTVNVYRQVCAFPNHVQSIELPQVDSNQDVKTSQETGCT